MLPQWRIAGRRQSLTRLELRDIVKKLKAKEAGRAAYALTPGEPRQRPNPVAHDFWSDGQVGGDVAVLPAYAQLGLLSAAKAGLEVTLWTYSKRVAKVPSGVVVRDASRWVSYGQAADDDDDGDGGDDCATGKQDVPLALELSVLWSYQGKSSPGANQIGRASCRERV